MNQVPTIESRELIAAMRQGGPSRRSYTVLWWVLLGIGLFVASILLR